MNEVTKNENKIIYVLLNKNAFNGMNEEKIIYTSIERLEEIKGDIKLRTEIIREVLHNAIDAGAESIDIIVNKSEEEGKVDILIEYEGDNKKLNSFKDVEEIVNALMKIDESAKRVYSDMDSDEKEKVTNQIGGKGRGLKIVLECNQLTITSINNNVINEIVIDKPNEQIENIFNSKKKIDFEIKVLKENEIEQNNKNKVRFDIRNVNTDNIHSFEQDNIKKYLKYFTVLSGVTDTYKENKIKVSVESFKLDSKLNAIKVLKEHLEVGDKFKELKEFAEKKKCNYTYIECADGKWNSNVKGLNFITKREEDELAEFFKDNKKCYIFRTQDTIFRKELKMGKGNESDFFGIYMGTEDVVINDRFEGLPTTNAGDKSGGNVYTQYFGYIYDGNAKTSGNRNSLSGDSTYFDTKDEVKSKVINIINKVLAFGDMYTKLDVLKGIDSIKLQGLFGELNFILKNPQYIKYWSSANQEINTRKPQDFYDENDTFVEIKTKLDKAHSGERDLIKISSVDQLYYKVNGKLIDGRIVIYYLKELNSKSMKGKNIIELISEVKAKLEDFQLESNDEVDYVNSLFIGIENCIGNNYGFNSFKDYFDDIDEHSYRYNSDKLKRYTVENFKTCEVDDKLKKILEFNLSDAIVLKDGYYLDLDKVRYECEYGKEEQIMIEL